MLYANVYEFVRLTYTTTYARDDYLGVVRLFKSDKTYDDGDFNAEVNQFLFY